MNENITFTEEEKYILQPLVEGETEELGQTILAYLSGYLESHESVKTTESDTYVTEIMENLYEKLCDIEPKVLDKVLAGYDWKNNCFEEVKN